MQKYQNNNELSETWFIKKKRNPEGIYQIYPTKLAVVEYPNLTELVNWENKNNTLAWLDSFLIVS